MSQYQHVMFAIDFGQEAGELIAKVVDRARSEEGKFSVMNLDYTLEKPYHAIFDIDIEKACEVVGKGGIHTVVDLLKGCDYSLEDCTRNSDDLALTLTVPETIDEYKVDLLMMGHHHYSWLGELTTSAAEPVVRKMPCDILLFKM